MIAPKPFKFVCTKCKYEKIVNPKSDVLNPLDYRNTCPKCKSSMDKKPLDSIESIFSVFK